MLLPSLAAAAEGQYDLPPSLSMSSATPVPDTQWAMKCPLVTVLCATAGCSSRMPLHPPVGDVFHIGDGILDTALSGAEDDAVEVGVDY